MLRWARHTATLVGIGGDGTGAAHRVAQQRRECTAVAVADVVGVAWHIACGSCTQCTLGHPARCLLYGDAQYGLLIDGRWGGTFSELIRVPFADYNLAPLPSGVDPVHLASIGDNLTLGWELVMPTISGIEQPEVAGRCRTARCRSRRRQQ